MICHINPKPLFLLHTYPFFQTNIFISHTSLTHFPFSLFSEYFNNLFIDNPPSFVFNQALKN